MKKMGSHCRMLKHNLSPVAMGRSFSRHDLGYPLQELCEKPPDLNLTAFSVK